MLPPTGGGIRRLAAFGVALYYRFKLVGHSFVGGGNADHRGSGGAIRFGAARNRRTSRPAKRQAGSSV
jgi:hypothetical protein